MEIFYAGIGSRETPEDIQLIIKKVARHLGLLNITLRSGAAQGADEAFEIGCDSVNGLKEIYLPWKGFQNSSSNLIVKDPKAFDLVQKFHPGAQHLSQGAMKLQARNSHQILGWDLKTPTDFVLCYTKNGKRSGGTGQALRIAEHYNIPIFDFGLYENDFEMLEEKYMLFLRGVFEKLREGKDT